MSEESVPVKEMNALQRIIGIFASPRETFESIDRKPTWVVPLVIVLLLIIGNQLMIIDIGIKDQIAMMEATGKSAEQIDQVRQAMDSPLRFISLPFTVIFVPIIWAILAGIFLGTGNLIIGGSTSFQKMFAMVSWTGVLALLSVPLLTFLILQKGTTVGIGFDLSMLLPAVPLGESKPFLNLLLARFDLFTIWQLVLWIIGMSVFYKVPVSKAATPMIILWVIYAAGAILLTNLFSGLMSGGA